MAQTQSRPALDLPPDFLSKWKDDIIGIKRLHLERKYRRCAVLCSEQLLKSIHPLHQTFLYFYQAVCFESLGHIAHDYSSKKIPLFEQARDAFISANDLLPLPFLTSVKGEYDELHSSPTCSTLKLSELYHECHSTCETLPSPINAKRRCVALAINEVKCQSTHQASKPYSVPRFEDYLPRQPLCDQTLGVGKVSLELRTPRQDASSNHKARLSRSMSSQHTLAENLVPSPLFSLDPPGTKDSQPQIQPSTDMLSSAYFNKPLPETPTNRPLPRLPFNQNIDFTSKGKRLIMVPRRKTALATLISKFEDRGMFEPPQLTRTNCHEDFATVKIPTTERFNRIAEIFFEVENKENIPPASAMHEGNSEKKKSDRYPMLCEEGRSNNFSGDQQVQVAAHDGRDRVTTKPLVSHDKSSDTDSVCTAILSPSTHLELYNKHLASFRTSILNHISAVTAKITQVRTIQLAHDADKRRSFANMHSPPSTALTVVSPTKSKPGTKNRSRDQEVFPAKDSRLHSFWSLPNTDVGTKSCLSKDGKASPLTWAEEQEARKRRDRIDNLRANGWKDVKKESKGWKGTQHYDALREKVEQELSMCGLDCET